MLLGDFQEVIIPFVEVLDERLGTVTVHSELFKVFDVEEVAKDRIDSDAFVEHP